MGMEDMHIHAEDLCSDDFKEAIEELEETKVTPWDIIKTGIGFVGSLSTTFVTGTILTNLMPGQTKMYKALGGIVGVYIIQSMVGAATESYLDKSLSEFDTAVETIFGS